MRNSLLSILTILALACSAMGQGRASASKGAAPSDGWQENGSFAVPFAAAKVRMKTRFEGQEYLLKHEIELGWRHDRCLMLWERRGRKVMVMLWRIDVNQTGFSIGEIKDDRK